MTGNPSFVLRSIWNVAIEERAIPQISSDEVLVEVKKTGICGSDVHYLVDGRIGDFVVNQPMVLGHESSGIIFKVGENVKHVKAGDRVALEPGSTCRKCTLCKAGRYELCSEIMFAATPPFDGTLSRFFRLPGDLAFSLPPNLSLEDGAMIEPLAVGVHSVSTVGQFRVGQSVLVFGCGPVGLLCMAVANAIGASRIIAVDIVPARLEFAKKYVATDIYLPPKAEPDETTVTYSTRYAKELIAHFGIEVQGKNVIDLVVECSGADVSVQTALHIAKAGGTVVQVGMGNPSAAIDVFQLISKEISLKGSFRYGPGDYPLAIALVAQGKIDLTPLVTHRFTFEESLSAFKVTHSGVSENGKEVIKAMISGPDFPVNPA